MARRRVVYVASSFPYGKNDSFFGPEVRELLRQGVDVLAVPVRPRGPLTTRDAEGLALRKPLLDREIAAAALRELVRAPRDVASAFALLFRQPAPNVLVRNLAGFPKALWLARVARAWRADHIHAHWAGPPSTVALVASRLSGIPWSFTAHAMEIEANNLLREKFRAATFVRFIAVAKMELARRIAPGADESRWTLVRLGVDVPPRRTARHAPNQLPVILVAARFGQEKRHDTFLEAVRLLLDRGVAVTVWFAGSGPQEDAVRGQVDALQLAEHVEFLGYVPNAQILEWLSGDAVDLAVLPSDSEGLPVSLVEALAREVPAVASDVGGVSELLGDGCGTLVPPHDPQALADAIGELLQSPERAAARVAAGRLKIEREFAIEVVVEQLRRLFGFTEVETPA